MKWWIAMAVILEQYHANEWVNFSTKKQLKKERKRMIAGEEESDAVHVRVI